MIAVGPAGAPGSPRTHSRTARCALRREAHMVRGRHVCSSSSRRCSALASAGGAPGSGRERQLTHAEWAACRSCGRLSRARVGLEHHSRDVWRRGRRCPCRAPAGAAAAPPRRILHCDHDPALTGGGHLAGVQREAGERPGADPPTLVARTHSARRVLDDSNAVAAATAKNASMSAGSPIWCTGTVGSVRLCSPARRARVEVVGARVDVGEHGWRRTARPRLRSR